MTQIPPHLHVTVKSESISPEAVRGGGVAIELREAEKTTLETLMSPCLHYCVVFKLVRLLKCRNGMQVKQHIFYSQLT